MDDCSRNGIELRHGMAQIEPGLRIHYVEAGDGPSNVVLLHGFPQTWWEWQRVIPPLVAADFHVVAIDYRGAGDSWRPTGGYDKWTMAGDVERVVVGELGLTAPVAVVGHDIGLMVAFAVAAQFRSLVSALVVIDAAVPGTAVFDQLNADPRVWHHAFHRVRDVPELLVSGRERQYLQAFFNARIFDPAAVSGPDFDRYVDAYSAPGAMRAGFELYRAFEQDAADNRAAIARDGLLDIPVLAVGGTTSTSGAIVEEMMREVAHDVTGVRIPCTGHWVPEENAIALADELMSFLRR